MKIPTLGCRFWKNEICVFWKMNVERPSSALVWILHGAPCKNWVFQQSGVWFINVIKQFIKIINPNQIHTIWYIERIPPRGLIFWFSLKNKLLIFKIFLSILIQEYLERPNTIFVLIYYVLLLFIYSTYVYYRVWTTYYCK